MGKNRFWGVVLGGLLTVVFGLSASSPAQAATSNVEVSADPTEEKAVTLTITGQTEANRRLWVVLIPTSSSSCPGNAPLDLLTTAYRKTLIEEDPLTAGNYERTVTFTPDDSGLYLACSYVAAGFSSNAVAKASRSFLVREPNATSSVSVSADPTEEKPVTVTVTGETEVNRSLWVVAYPVTRTSGSNCPGNDPFDLLTAAYNEVLLEEDPVLAGSYRRTVTFTPEDSGPYLVCSYVAEGIRVTANAKAGKTFQAREPNVTSNVTPSPDPTIGKPVTLTITGQTELNRSLWVVAYPVNRSRISRCPGDDPTDLLGYGYLENLISEEPLSAGSYRRTVTFTPENSGPYLVCSYVSEGERVEANAKVSKTFEVRRKGALMSVIPEGPFQHLSKIRFSIEGVTEVAGELTSYIYRDSLPCPAVPSGKSDKDHVEPGKFESKGWSVVPDVPTTVRICAYLTDPEGEIAAVSSVEVPVERNPAFLPKLTTRNGRVGFGGPPTLRWKSGLGPGTARDFVELFRKKPTPSSRPMKVNLDAVWFSGGYNAGFWSLSFDRSYDWGYGRWWWRIRRTTAGGYSETSRPRFVISAPSRR